jgi:glycosyltransferase involved in cell wall biosynthesis
VNEYVLLYDDKSRLGSFAKNRNVTEVAAGPRIKLVWDQVVVPWLAWRHKLDVIFNPKLSVPLLAGAMTVLVQHGADWFEAADQYPLYDRLYVTLFARLYWRKANRIVSVSNDASHRLARRMDEKTAAKLHTIYHGVDQRFNPSPDPEAVTSLRARYGLDSPFILYLGQIYPMKNVGGLIRAFATLRDRLPHKLVLVGQPGVSSEQDLALIDELGLSDRVVRVGWVPREDVPLFYNAADIFAFPSLYEGFGIPIIEAMASGCPVVTSTGGACPEVAGDAALLVDPRNIDSIADGIHAVLTHSQLRANLVERGLARARHFTWDRSARQTIQLFESLTREAGTERGPRISEGRSP